MRWFSEALPPDSVLWGINLFWWERIGKIAQVVGGVTIIADIIGAERIRKFGQTLHSAIPSKSLYNTLKNMRNMKEAYRPIWKGFFYFCVTILVVCLIIFAGGWLENYGKITALEALEVTAYVGGWMLFGMLIFVLAIISLLIFFRVLAIMIDIIFIEPLAWVLERPSLEQLVKIFALLLLLAGFHFDLLAS